MIDLFAGTGAFSHAFHGVRQGCVESVFANDMVERSKLIYDANHTSHAPLTLQDLNEVDVANIPPHDILTGGFPCQPFSIAGKQAGFQDARSNVFWKILEIIDYHRPICIVLENVKNLVTHNERRTFEIIRKHLEDRGYYLHFKVLNTAEITGIPQHRERIYIVGLRSKQAHDMFNLDFPIVEKRPITTMLEEEVPDKYYSTADTDAGRMTREQVVRTDTIYQYRRVYVRENKSNECPTLTANMGAGGHNVPFIRDKKGVRKLTPRECFRFQGFPDSYILPRISDASLYQLAGNAVSVPVVRLIAERLLRLPLHG